MWIISKRRLRESWEIHADAKDPLEAWYSTVAKAQWQKWADVKATYPSADLVGDCAVFNIGGNKYRLIARIRYQTHKVYVLKVLTHGAYNSGRWRDECGCYATPPKERK